MNARRLTSPAGDPAGMKRGPLPGEISAIASVAAGGLPRAHVRRPHSEGKGGGSKGIESGLRIAESGNACEKKCLRTHD